MCIHCCWNYNYLQSAATDVPGLNNGIIPLLLWKAPISSLLTKAISTEKTYDIASIPVSNEEFISGSTNPTKLTHPKFNLTFNFETRKKIKALQ